MVLLDDEILAYASDALGDALGEATGELSQSSPILSTLQADPVRKRILQAGRAMLRVRVGNHPWDTIPLCRVDGEVDWSVETPAASLPRPASEVSAAASKGLWNHQTEFGTAGATFCVGVLLRQCRAESSASKGSGEIRHDLACLPRAEGQAGDAFDYIT
jgi:hypothetical protein